MYNLLKYWKHRYFLNFQKGIYTYIVFFYGNITLCSKKRKSVSNPIVYFIVLFRVGFVLKQTQFFCSEELLI